MNSEIPSLLDPGAERGLSWEGVGSDCPNIAFHTFYKNFQVLGSCRVVACVSPVWSVPGSMCGVLWRGLIRLYGEFLVYMCKWPLPLSLGFRFSGPQGRGLASGIGLS